MNDIIELRASPMRRIFALMVLISLVVLLGAMGLGDTMPPVAQMFLLGLGALIAWLAEKMRRATLQGLHLTPDGLFDDQGALIAGFDQIARVDRGVFAFKPSNGFLLTLHDRAPGRWMPGLWWRRGRRIGVGGVTPSAPAKAMAEAIALRIASDAHKKM